MFQPKDPKNIEEAMEALLNIMVVTLSQLKAQEADYLDTLIVSPSPTALSRHFYLKRALEPEAPIIHESLHTWARFIEERTSFCPHLPFDVFMQLALSITRPNKLATTQAQAIAFIKQALAGTPRLAKRFLELDTQLSKAKSAKQPAKGWQQALYDGTHRHSKSLNSCFPTTSTTCLLATAGLTALTVVALMSGL